MIQKADSCDCVAINEDVVDQVRASIPSDDDFLAMERLFAVMGNPTRARILLALALHEMCVGDLSVLLNMSKSAVSHQLANLRDERLVSTRRDGRVVYYEPADPHVALMLKLGLEHAHECCPCQEVAEGMTSVVAGGE